MNVSLRQLYSAYRKAKKEAFSDTNCAHGLKFSEYEAALEERLLRLKRAVNRSGPQWQHDLDFLGGVTCIPKSVTAPVGSDFSIHYQCSDPLEQWRRQCKTERAQADFRPVINASVDFLVISALWILEVGHLYEAKLDTRWAVGNRLKRWRPRPDAPEGSTGELNRLAPDLFQPYFSAYGKWRSAGLKAMRREMKDGHRIAAVTMDLKRFYHQIDASFRLREDYLVELSLALTSDQRAFTQHLIDAITTWNEAAHERFHCGNRGIPVGLPASGLIANVLLRQFDHSLVTRLQPSHYGRYVDDVFLVLRCSNRFASGQAFIRWLAKRLGDVATALIPTKRNAYADGPSLKILLPYAEGSELVFVGKKQKIFQLKGKQGIDMIGPIEEQIRKQSSEFRDLPDLPDSERGMAFRALIVTPDATLDADALRKADAVTLRRSGFAMLLGDVEAHARDLDVSDLDWRRVRAEFYGLAQRHLVTPTAFFDYSRYLGRVVSLMIGCGDWDHARRFIDAFEPLLKTLRATCQVKTGTIGDTIAEASKNLGERIVEAILRSVSSGTTQGKALLRRVQQVFGPVARFPATLSIIGRRSLELVRLDWSMQPYWVAWMESRVDSNPAAAKPNSPSARSILPFSAISKLRIAASLPQPHWPALAFPTRPLPVSEITLRAPVLLKDAAQFRAVVMQLRGTWMPEFTGLSIRPPTSKRPQEISVPYVTHWKPRIAITSLEVEDIEWSNAADGRPVLSLHRYRRLAHLLDSIIESKVRPNYVVLPELCLPRRWAVMMAHKLVQRRISLIAGLEYRQDRTRQNCLHNEALIALRTVFPGYETSLLLLQAKQQPAWRERQQLADAHSKHLADPGRSVFDRPVYIHQGFRFGVLICSELTDIRNRSHFQGRVDALFVPEWNQDIKSFTSLVESSALDVHAYIIQANNRRFGDSRMRAPMKEHFRRDVVRVKGGLNDYFVIGEIDYMALRRFQSHDVPPVGDDEQFKPFPIGFRLSTSRRATTA